MLDIATDSDLLRQVVQEFCEANPSGIIGLQLTTEATICTEVKMV
jgi:hypothetical protein